MTCNRYMVSWIDSTTSRNLVASPASRYPYIVIITPSSTTATYYYWLFLCRFPQYGESASGLAFQHLVIVLGRTGRQQAYCGRQDGGVPKEVFHVFFLQFFKVLIVLPTFVPCCSTRGRFRWKGSCGVFFSTAWETPPFFVYISLSPLGSLTVLVGGEASISCLL